MLCLGSESPAPFERWVCSWCRVGQLCGTVPAQGTRGGDYGQAEMTAIRESGLHLALLRARLSNSCFNQWNCEILQLP